jgi:ATP-dependent Lon protease
VINGLAYTSVGGKLLLIESSVSSVVQGTRKIKFSGNLKDVMKESMQIAYSFSRNFLKSKNNDFLEK